jgi:tRNA A-37 threonylcarbamoyl transferase component Bud32
MGMEVLNAIMQWVVAPVAAVVVWIYVRVQQQAVDIAVIQATQAANKEAHDREFKEVKSSFTKVLDKLENIEAHLRK